MNAVTELTTFTETSVLRFITCGSVDDGKSTLIGRLLFDAKSVLADQLAAISKAKHKRTVGDAPDLSLLTDGLEAEREQGITIDVAYRYFATANRKFIIADCPGHVQYTRNMVTGASTADAAIILIDATRVKDGQLLEQTRRHSAIVKLLGVRHVVVAVNKMDLIGFDEAAFNNIKSAFEALAQRLGLPQAHVIPVSALNGDNIVDASTAMPWYAGSTLLPLLESLDTHNPADAAALRFPVQWVLRANAHTADDVRGLSGTVSAGTLRVGDVVKVATSGAAATVARIMTYDGDLPQATTGQAITVVLDHDIDASRGDLLIAADDAGVASRELTADLCWLDAQALNPARKYWLKYGSKTLQAKVIAVEHVIDVQTLRPHHSASVLQLNDIGRVRLALQQPLLADAYAASRETGRFVLIDTASHQTAAAGLVVA
jgi:sulfate adenylyltransferase subunit 1